jgi:hypothetical protein
MDEAVRLAAQMNITLAELLGGVELPKAPLARQCLWAAVGRRREVA